ncbi:MAG TPA: HD domain-containing phosphohydrolase [Spirochaetota bacterium]|nr:HD domain-containing phosphohydrolase [Spirochaetota bacterium]HOL56641.1 HD domain-containing phosphohydrolase [Spirochaetota bacterium]HPP03731.1 HD domain-containing phosphohydrolase [Spirochaetota bacterium]
MKKIGLIIIILTFFIINLNADNKTDSLDKYNSGMEKFQKGDIDGAIDDLRQAVSLDDRNFKAKKSLVDVLLVKGKNLINAEKYDEAQEMLKEAYRLFPSNQEVADLYKGLKDGTIQEQKKKEKEQIEKEKLASNTETKEDSSTTTTIQQKSSDQTTQKESSGTKSEILEIEKKYLAELERQRKTYERIIENYKGGGNVQMDPNFIKKQTEIFDSFITKYNELLKQNEEDRKKNMEVLIEQMKENRKIMEKQGGISNTIIITIVSSFLLAVILFILAFYILFFIAKRKKPATVFSNETISELSNSLYIENENSKKPQLIYDEQEEKDMSLVESEMLKDLLKSEKLKKMHLEMKQGTLTWDTIKEYITEMNKDLRVEILKIVETKLLNEDINNEMVVLPILFPFLTDGDDYIREKAKSLITTNIKKLKPVNNDIIIQQIAEGGSINIQELSLKSQEIDKLLYRINHSYNISRYAKGIANILGFSKERQYLIYETALVHDIGYNFIDKNVLYNIKNKKELSEEDFIEIRKHPIKGKEFLEKFDDVQKEMLEGVLYHHERNDGSGYPEGLKKENIPIFAKIIGVCDTFEALTSQRFHKEKLSFKSGLVIIKDMGKNKFNTEIIEALEEYLIKTNLINMG